MDYSKIVSDQRREIKNTFFGNYINRKEQSSINLNSNLAQVVTGVRRCGKSMMCKKVLADNGLNFGYANFDDERLANMHPEEFDMLLQEMIRQQGLFNHLFLDEVQNVEGWELFVNRMLREGMRVIITGSNANLLSSDLTTHLAGRHHEIKLFPFSFTEYCRAKKIDIHDASTIGQGLRMAALDQYMFEGGFPEIVNGEASDDYARSLLHTVVYKDICQRNRIKYKESVWRLANTVLDHFCQPQISGQLAKEVDIRSTHTVDNYMRYLADAYLIALTNKFTWKSSDRRRTPKAFAIDPAFISHHSESLQSQSLGWRLENTVAIELLNRNDKKSDNLYYLRNSRDFEVDFVAVKDTHVNELVQVTYDFADPSTKLFNREIMGLVKGSALTGCSNLTLVVMQGKKDEISLDNKLIKVRSACDWLIDD